MRAAIRSGFFGSVLSFTTTQKEPSFSPSKNPNQVLIKVHAAGINPVDYKLPKVVARSIYGLDFSGTVENVGSDVKSFKVGDKVFGGTMGAMADYCVSKETEIAKKSDSFTFKEAAALPVAYLTALQGIRDVGNTQRDSILVIGASGGCGMAAVQLAKAMGFQRIVGICSAKNAQLVREAGATQVVDYTDQQELKAFFQENAGKFDLVFDSATGSGGGEDYTTMSIPLLTEDSGEYVQLNGPASVWLRYLTGIGLPKHQHLILTNKNKPDLEEILSLMEKIDAKPVMTTMPFTEQGVKDGFELLKSRRAKGKIVFDITPA